MKELKSALQENADPKKAALLQRYFKTGKGEYGEGDLFLGIVVPKLRKLAKQYTHLSLNNLQLLLNSKFHEERMVALLILVNKFKKPAEEEKQQIFDFYQKNTKHINNWDLIDLTAPKIIGEYLKDKDRSILYSLAKSENVWERRIAVLSAFAFIRDNDFEDAIKISELLLKDKHDLIHKAVGWMLREAGKRNVSVLENFLDKHGKEMPRTMLRYAIEKFPDEKRKFYLNKE